MRVFVVEIIQGPDSYLLGVFQDFDDMVTKLEDAVRTEELHSSERELSITRAEVGTLTHYSPCCNATFDKDGTIKFKFGWDMTLETLRAP